MLPLLPLAAAGAGIGLLKSEFIDKPNEEKDRAIQSITDRFSPWTGMRGRAVERTNPIGDAAAMGAQGAMFGGALNSAKAQDDLNSAIAGKLGFKGGQDAMTAGALGAASAGAPYLAAPVGGRSPSLFDDPNALNYKSALGSGSLSQNSVDPTTLAILMSAMSNRRASGLI